MSWSITASHAQSPPPSSEAVYFLILEKDNKILWENALESGFAPMEHLGSFSSYKSTLAYNTPLIPLDTHTALVLGWVDMQTMIRNRPYLDDTIRAAVALVA